MRLDFERIIKDFKKKNPEYKNTELHVETHTDHYEIKNIRNKLIVKVDVPEGIDDKPIIFGYARVSTKGQARDGNSLEVQEEVLKEAGAEIIYKDAFTGTSKDRPELDRLLKEIREGDTLVVTKLDRIARSVSQGIELIDELARNNIKVIVLNLGTLDNSVTGRLIRNVMLCFAEFERDMIMQRTHEGKELARRREGYKEGPKFKYSPEQIEHALELLKDHSYAEVVRMTGISKSTLIRAARKS